MIPSSLYCSTCGAANAVGSLVCFACKQPLSVVISDNAPLLQGRYRILTQVGKGGFGAVYRAEDTQKHNAIVAIKQINLRGLTPQETIEATDAFNREVSLLTNLDSPNLPHIHDNFTDPEHWYLVMDFIEGETLETYLEGKDAHYTMPLGEVLALGVQLCTVLDYLHTREPAIIFRDLKPANIMRTRANKLYLIDFGIARRYNPAKLKDTIPFGSPGYAAPEQYGKSQTTARADIYSLGALLHMLLTGDDPVDSPFHFSPLRMYSAFGIAELEKLIMRMVELKAEDRPASVNEVKAELQRIENLQNGGRVWQPPIGQVPDPFSGTSSNGGSQQQLYLSGKGQQLLYMPPAQRTRLARRKFIVGSLAVVGLTAIGAGAVSNIAPLFQYRGSVIGAASPPALFANKYIYNGHSAPVWSVAGYSDNGYIASASDDGTVQVWFPAQVMQNAPSNVQLATSYKVGEPVSTLAWGHFNGSDLLAFSKGTSVYVWNLKNTPFSFQAIPKVSAGDVQEPIYALAWSPDRRHIAFPTSYGLQLYNVDTKKVDGHLPIPDGSSAVLYYPNDTIVSIAWSPDGTQIAAGTQNGRTFVWDVASGKLKADTTFIGGGSIAWSPNGLWLATVSNDRVYVASVTDPIRTQTYFQSLGAGISALAWSPDGRYIVSGCAGGSDANIMVWSPFVNADSSSNKLATPTVESEVFYYSLETHQQDIHSLTWWLNDDGYIVVGADKAYILELRANMLNS